MNLTRSKNGTKSCGCTGKSKLFKTKSTKHYRRLYHIWHSMLDRCKRKTNPYFHIYGGRGIKVCAGWQDFGMFYNDMIDSYSPGLTLERVQNDDGYCLENCTWIPNEDQAKNRMTTVWVNGLCAKEACKLSGISYTKFLSRKRNFIDKTPQEVFDQLVLEKFV